MRTKLILGSLLAFFSATQAQWFGTNPLWTNSDVGINTNSPTYRLDVVTTPANNGIRISKAAVPDGACGLYLDNKTSGGRMWSILSLGHGDADGPGHFSIWDNNMNVCRMFIEGSNDGKVGIGTTAPTEKLSISCSSMNDGISATQTGNTAAALHLTSGNHWALFSTGSANTQGNGNFSIFQYAGGDRLFIDGTSGNVGIGMTAPINAQLDVRQNHTSGWNRAVYGNGYGSTGGTNLNIGVEGRSGSDDCSAQNIAVWGRSYGGNVSIGGEFYGTSACAGSTSYGIYAQGDTYAGFFSGDIYHTGAILGPSDRRLKENIQPMTNSLDKIKLLKPSTYVYKKGIMKLPDGPQLGLIAQELEQVFPELVHEIAGFTKKDETGKEISSIVSHKSVDYIGLIPVLIGGIQEQQKLIDELREANVLQQKQINELLSNKQGGSTGVNQLEAETDGNMGQNEPNPFTHETTIKYNIPQTVSNSFLAVYDLTGKQITSFPIEQKGSSAITITSEKLAAGIYIYSIVADGKVIDSKRMIVAEK